MNFSTPSFNPGPFNHELFNPGLFNHTFLKHGVEKFMVEKSGVEMSFNHLLERRNFNPGLFNHNFSTQWFKNSKNHGLKVWGWKLHGWKVWGRKVRGWKLWSWDVLQPKKKLQFPHLFPHVTFDLHATSKTILLHCIVCLARNARSCWPLEMSRIILPHHFLGQHRVRWHFLRIHMLSLTDYGRPERKQPSLHGQ